MLLTTSLKTILKGNATLLYDDYAGLSSDLSFQFALGGNFAGGAGNVVLNFQYDEVGTVFTGDVPRLYNRKTGRCGDLFRANAYNPDAAYQSQYIGFGSEVPYAVRNGSFNGRTKIDRTGCITLSTLPETGRASPYETALSATFASKPFYGIWPDGNHYHFVGSGDLGVYDVGIPYGNAFALKVMTDLEETTTLTERVLVRLNLVFFKL